MWDLESFSGGGFDDMMGTILWMIKAFSVRCSRYENHRDLSHKFSCFLILLFAYYENAPSRSENLPCMNIRADRRRSLATSTLSFPREAISSLPTITFIAKFDHTTLAPLIYNFCSGHSCRCKAEVF